MAKAPTFSLIILIFIAISLPTNSKEFPTKGEMRRSQQLTHFLFYFHYHLRGNETSVLVVAQAPTTNTYRTRFGEVQVVDIRLTEGPNLSSRTLGRAQGLFTYADVRETGLLMVYNYFFTEGRYNGSTLNVMGRYPPRSDNIEMAVIGGSGHLRGARGYVRVRELVNDLERGIDIDEHHVSVIFPSPLLDI
ncbi:dirigent protein 21-like [Salvia hispanica]|uniref:dirigent protein 21-like n=1 Tax=Salvia hispanica TaxID=49212 RepID=UPI0020095052|nr:dirigent protein 21-like [Salvia hispanica]